MTVRWWTFWVSVCLPPLLVPGLAGAAPDAPSYYSDASAVMEKVVERAQALADSSASCTYRKTSLIEELDKNGEVKQSTEREYEVLLIGGYPFNRLLSIKGQELGERALEQENKRERQSQSRMTFEDSKKLGQRKQSWLTKDLVDRFAFTVRERTHVNGRPTLVLDFSPKPNADTKSLQDKFLAEFAGTLAVDEEDFAVVRLSTRLQNPISVGWFGCLGMLENCELKLERTRVADGIWANLNQTINVLGRKLLTPISLRITEQSTDFRCPSAASDQQVR